MMMPQRIPFGMDRLPRGLSPDDLRLPAAAVGAEPLRLNTEPLPVEAMAAATGDHAARVAAMRSHLHSLCGDYAPARLRFIDVYFDALAAHINAHRDELARVLQRYEGLYAPQDWLWSALRPLPRALIRCDAGVVPVDFAFWDGAQAIAIDLGGNRNIPGVAVCPVTPEMLAGKPLALLQMLPDAFREFWQGETLPRSPFRRAIPLGVLAA
ncbi:MAG TPA: hypothetical protein VMU81_18645 [Acetobacteraceae bacterium]|nr:hypothetical protein [Acetobacteraceae bacterium]